MYYRSDWPEIGLPKALIDSDTHSMDSSLNENYDWIQETDISGVKIRLRALKDEFESKLYGASHWHIHLEMNNSNSGFSLKQLDSAQLFEYINTGIHRLLDYNPEVETYLTAKSVKGEPLYNALLQANFQEMEVRRSYEMKATDLASMLSSFTSSGIHFTSLAEVPQESLQQSKKQIIEICKNVFKQGYSRHFQDAILVKKLPGVSYIVAAMELNFEKIPLNNFIIASDNNANTICGFSIISKRGGLSNNLYSQLLSAVHKSYQNRGIHRGLTHVVAKKLPQDAKLLNIFQANNLYLNNIYKSRNRIKIATHIGDLTVLRRIY